MLAVSKMILLLASGKNLKFSFPYPVDWRALDEGRDNP
jgi:hypothetical protein